MGCPFVLWVKRSVPRVPVGNKGYAPANAETQCRGGGGPLGSLMQNFPNLPSLVISRSKLVLLNFLWGMVSFSPKTMYRSVEDECKSHRHSLTTNYSHLCILKICLLRAKRIHQMAISREMDTNACPYWITSKISLSSLSGPVLVRHILPQGWQKSMWILLEYGYGLYNLLDTWVKRNNEYWHEELMLSPAPKISLKSAVTFSHA